MKKIVCLIMSAVLGACIFVGCHIGGGSEPDVYEDGKLVIEYFAIDLDSVQAPTEGSRAIMDVIENKFGVKIKATTGTAGSWSVLLNQLIGGGDCPDVFFHLREEPSYSSWLEDDYLFNYSEKLDNYPLLKSLFEQFDPNLKGFLGGDYYSLPIMMRDDPEGDVLTEHAMFYRRDWYEKVKADGYQPESGRELVDPEDENFNYLNFYDLAEAFTYGDPDGNGEDDTVGYGLNKDSGVYWWYPLLSMFNVDSKGWMKDEDGRWVPEATSDAMKEAVMFIADMYDKGFINQNYNTTTTMDMMKNDFANGVSGMMVYNATFPMGRNILELMVRYMDEGDHIFDVVRPMPVVTGKNGKKQMLGSPLNYGYTAINNDISDLKKEKILDIMEWMLTEEGKTLLDWGIEGEHYVVEEGKKVSILPDDNNGNQRLLSDATVAPAAFRLKGLVSWAPLIPDTTHYYEESKIIAEAWKPEYLFLDELYYVAVPSSMGLKQGELNDMVATCYKNIVTKIPNNAAAAREQIWNSFVETYNERGSEYIDMINEQAKNLI